MVPSNWKAPGDTVLLSQAAVTFVYDVERTEGLLEVLLFLSRRGRLLPTRHMPGEFVYQISSQKNPIFSYCCQRAAISGSSPDNPLHAYTTGSKEGCMDVDPDIHIYMCCASCRLGLKELWGPAPPWSFHCLPLQGIKASAMIFVSTMCFRWPSATTADGRRLWSAFGAPAGRSCFFIPL